MTCLSSLSDNLTPLVPDTSVLINLHACSFGEQVLRAIPNDIILPDRVVAELNHETSHTNGENGFIQRLISEQVVKVVQLNDAAYCNFETLIRSPGSLDDGEAATIAVAAAMGFVPVVDERKGRARVGHRARAKALVQPAQAVFQEDAGAVLARQQRTPRRSWA